MNALIASGLHATSRYVTLSHVTPAIQLVRLMNIQQITDHLSMCLSIEKQR